MLRDLNLTLAYSRSACHTSNGIPSVRLIRNAHGFTAVIVTGWALRR